MLTSQPKEVSREMSGITFYVYSTSCVFRHSGIHLKDSFSQTRERFVIGAMSKRGQDTTSSDGSPMAKARPTSLVLQGQCKEGASSQGRGSPVNPVNEYNRKRVSRAAGNPCSSSSNAEVGSSQVYRQEMVNLAARKPNLVSATFSRGDQRQLFRASLFLKKRNKWCRIERRYPAFDCIQRNTRPPVLAQTL